MNRKMSTICLALFAGAILSALGQEAKAQGTLLNSPASFSSYEDPVGETYTQTSTGSYSYSAEEYGYYGPLAFNSASTGSGNVPSPNLSASVSSNDITVPGYPGGSSAGANYQYYAEYIPTSPGVPTNINIPTIVSWSGSATITGAGAEGNALGEGRLEVSATPGYTLNYGNFNAVDFLGTQYYSGQVDYDASADVPFVIQGSVYAQTGGYNGSVSVYFDPYIYINPSFASIDPNYATDYSLVLSSGVGNSISAAPEPSAWTLLVAGVGVAGAMLRLGRRRGWATA